MPKPFTYPRRPHARRHGPSGWKSYQRYRPWLRDDFDFRCVFCLVRERWVDMRRSFPVDHFVPHALRPKRGNNYENLLYVCPNCNGMKSKSLVPDPCRIAMGRCLTVTKNGKIKAMNSYGKSWRDVLALNGSTMNEYRRMMIGMLRTLARFNHQQFVDWMRLPDDLPDLRNERPPRNCKPEGIAETWLAKKQRGGLTELYYLQ